MPNNLSPDGDATGSSIADLTIAAELGDREATAALFTELYGQLHRLAKLELARPGGPIGLGATTLLHETYLSMASRDGASFPDRARFMKYASRAMRGLIIDESRSRRAHKRGGEFHITSLDTDSAENSADCRELTRIGEALDELAKSDSELAELVDLKFFCGFSFAEIAAMRNLSERTVQRQWEKARIFLHHSIRTGAR